MTTKQFAILMGIITLICFGAFIMVLFFINPETTGGLGYLLFYFSLFFGIILAGSMFMQANRLLTWVNAILLVILLTVIEFLIISLKKA